jgi:hypothetical protein
MANIGVYCTDQKKILVVSKASSLPTLLGDDERIRHSWFYNKPPELERFLNSNPNEKDLFDQALAYWVYCKLFQIEIKKSAYGNLKRRLKEFHEKLLIVLHDLIENVVNNIKSTWQHCEKAMKKTQKFYEREFQKFRNGGKGDVVMSF